MGSERFEVAWFAEKCAEAKGKVCVTQRRVCCWTGSQHPDRTAGGLKVNVTAVVRLVVD